MKLLDYVSNVGGNIAEGIGNFVESPIESLGLDDMAKMFSDPEELERYLASLEADGDQWQFADMPEIPRAPAPYFPLQTGGFMNQNPQFMNTDQLILQGS